MLVNAEQPDKSMNVSAVHPDKALTSVTAAHPLMPSETKERHEAARELTSTTPLHPDISSATRWGQEARQEMSNTQGLLRMLGNLSDEQAASELISPMPGQLLISREVRERHSPSNRMLAKSPHPASSSRCKDGEGIRGSTSASPSTPLSERDTKRGNASSDRMCWGGQPLPSIQVN